METVLMIIAAVSFVAFVVGMFNPSTVKCSSRGKVALIFASAFIVCAIIGGSLSEEKPEISNSIEKRTQEQAQDSKPTSPEKEETPKEVTTLVEGAVLELPYADGKVEILFKDITATLLPNGKEANLVFTLRIKNNTSEQFFISNARWKLLDSEKVEVEEAGIYEPVFDGFTPGTFFFTVVDPNVGKEEKAGYVIKAETYYLSVNGHIVAKISFDTDKE